MSSLSETHEDETELLNSSLELESINFFVRMMSILGFPRSVGEIYGLLYFTPNPLTMEQIAKRLGISIGSASQGLKSLRSLKAVRTNYIPGDRRDHYLAEREFRRLFSTFIKDVNFNFDLYIYSINSLKSCLGLFNNFSPLTLRI